ncbi:MAG: adenylosuccinate lyase [Candidatus Melainabacteria bacterium]|nr:adenylosuccinate lyase [Candidatus Melainabacteria bacterium]MBI3309592.1 adenylosuccinate lyase [Candidatus Melainabacteria bacterium]
MIKRYTRPIFEKLWSEENKYAIWLEVELAACEASAEFDQIPQEAIKKIKEKAKINIKRIEELDTEVHHDVIAFLSSLTEQIGNEGRFLHLGMTSSDLIDTAFAILLRDAGKEILKGLDLLLEAFKTKAIEHKNIICIGRTHGVHAEPTTFGLKLLNFYEDLKRVKERFEKSTDDISVGMFSGAVGTYANFDPKIEEIALKKLGLKPVPISTQVISRERHAAYITNLALIASVIEKIATELRHLQRTEVLEVEEPFYKGQKGSSAMPHKRNPWKLENLCGLARLVRSYAISSMENVTLWHERDISHSSVERIIFPDSTTLVDFMVHRLYEIISKLNIYPENMKENMFRFGGVVFSQTVLLKLVEKGLERENAYKLIQDNALAAWNKKDGNFKQNILTDSKITNILSKEEINDCFNPEKHLKNIDSIFNRVLNVESKKEKSLAL